jgi:hypothetical protein
MDNPADLFTEQASVVPPTRFELRESLEELENQLKIATVEQAELASMKKERVPHS